jgi:putative sugar O-methyltransferase
MARGLEMNLDATIATLSGKAPYQNYLRVRRNVIDAMTQANSATSRPSNYWQEELAGFEYMLDASPLIIEKLREHCYHLTGIRPYEYRQHHGHAAKAFAHKLEMLKALDGSHLFVPESRALGGFGHEIDGGLVNFDTLKFYESLIAMDRAGLLEAVRSKPNERQVWIEIGAGWGGFGYVVKTLFPQVSYVLVDLPQSLLFSATYLMSAFPDARCAIYPETSLEECSSHVRDYDFVFLPHFVFPELKLKPDLAVNMASFQEMTTAQVTDYVKHVAEMGCPALYSHNRERSGHNTELTAVSSIIAENFAKPREIDVLSFSYTLLAPPAQREKAKPAPESKAWFSFGKEKAPKSKASKPLTRGPTDYRHYVAERP